MLFCTCNKCLTILWSVQHFKRIRIFLNLIYLKIKDSSINFKSFIFFTKKLHKSKQSSLPLYMVWNNLSMFHRYSWSPQLKANENIKNWNKLICFHPPLFLEIMDAILNDYFSYAFLELPITGNLHILTRDFIFYTEKKPKKTTFAVANTKSNLCFWIKRHHEY